MDSRLPEMPAAGAMRRELWGAGRRRWLRLGIVVPSSLIVFSLLASASWGAQEEVIYQKWEEVSSLRATGQFERAVEILKSIIQEYSNSDDVLRLAYNNLVYTYYVANDVASEDVAAREALGKFPDLRAGDAQFPSVLNDLYERLRREMFGSLVIARPERARVFLDETYKGESPIRLPLVPVGSHVLEVAKSGYYDYTQPVEVEPNLVRELEVSLRRQKDVWWWVTRVGVPTLAVAAGVTVALIAGGDEGGPAEPEPLPGPPSPPTR